MPIEIPEGVTVEIKDNLVSIVGPKGKLGQKVRREIEVKKEDKKIIVKAKKDSRIGRSLHGLFRTLIANMIVGVTKGFSKDLELHGVGYRAALEAGKLMISVGFSHPVIVEPIEGIEFKVEEQTKIKISGIDKQLVGNVAAQIRDIKKPEPYKGKGIRYMGEIVKKKPGKAAKAGAGGE